MSLRRSLLRWVYPFLMFVNSRKKGNVIEGDHPPITSFYDLSATLNSGEVVAFSAFRNRKVLVVNTASDCGYTHQYKALKQLAEIYPQLVILLFPSNDFKEQERGSDEAIAQFCETQYGLNLPLIKKCVVRDKEGSHPIYQWLSGSAQNGWNDLAPQWNFWKYLINEKGHLTHVMQSGVDPLSKTMRDALQLH